MAAGRSIDYFDVLISNNCCYSGRTLYSRRERNKIDSISLILDDGSCFVGDLEPIEHLGAYDSNPVLQND